MDGWSRQNETWREEVELNLREMSRQLKVAEKFAKDQQVLCMCMCGCVVVVSIIKIMMHVFNKCYQMHTRCMTICRIYRNECMYVCVCVCTCVWN